MTARHSAMMPSKGDACARRWAMTKPMLDMFSFQDYKLLNTKDLHTLSISVHVHETASPDQRFRSSLGGELFRLVPRKVGLARAASSSGCSKI